MNPLISIPREALAELLRAAGSPLTPEQYLASLTEMDIYKKYPGRAWAAAVSIGVRPTFQTGRGELIEAYVLDFDGDLYGRELRLDFLARLRGERRFETAEALIEQMHRDVQRTRELAAIA